MARKRSHCDEPSRSTFHSEHDRELFELDRNVLSRIVYKNQYQFRRIDILDRVKVVIKMIDLFLKTGDSSLVPLLLERIYIASERFFQHVAMGLMLPLSLTCVAALARLGDILRRVPRKMESDSAFDSDEGEIISR